MSISKWVSLVLLMVTAVSSVLEGAETFSCFIKLIVSKELVLPGSKKACVTKHFQESPTRTLTGNFLVGKHQLRQ